MKPLFLLLLLFFVVALPLKSQQDSIALLSDTTRKETKKPDTLLIVRPFSDKYFFAPSAYGLKRREAYYQNTLVLVNSFSYGITDHFTVGASVMFTGFSSTFSELMCKYHFEVVKNLRAAAGLAILSTGGFPNPVLYGLVTVGNPLNNLTVGYYPNLYTVYYGMHLFSVGGMLRVNKRLSLVTDNWYGAEHFLISSLGIRILGKKMALDLGAIKPVESISWIPIDIYPYADLMIRFK